MKQHGLVLRIVSLSLVAGLVAGCHTDPNVRKRKYLASGDRYSAEGKYREAAIQYENSLKADKNFPDAHYALAQDYMHMGAISAAYREFSRTVELQPSNYRARIDLANLLVAGGQIQKAQEQAKLVAAAQPNNADLHALLSAIALKQGDRKLAMTEIRRAMQLAPDRAVFYDDLALLEVHDPSDATQAEIDFKKAAEVDPKSENAKLLLTGYYLDANRTADAEQISKAAIAADPKSLAARSSLAQVYLKEGNPQQAEQVLRQASEELSNDPHGVRILADYYASTGQFEKARAEFARLVAKYPKNIDLQKGYLRTLLEVRDESAAQDVANKLMKEDSGDPEIAALNGIVLLSKGDATDAVTALQEGAQNFPQDAFIQYWLGRAALAKGDASLAQKSFQQVVTLRPKSLDALQQLAQIAEQQGDMSLLSDVAGKAISNRPDFAAGYIWRAIEEIHQNVPDKAEDDLKTAMHLAPQNPQPYFELGKLRFSQKRFPEGAALLEQSLQLDPDLLPAMRLLVSYDLATKQPGKALDSVNAQIQKRPQDTGYLDMLAELQVYDKNLDAAAATAQKAIQINPADAQAVMLFAEVAARRGQTASAIGAWQKWTSAHPKDANAIAMLATLEQSTGNKQSAEADYRRSLDIQPQQPIAANNLAYIMLQNGENVDVALSLAQIARRAMPNSPDTADTLAWAYYQKGTYAFARDLLMEAVKENPNSATLQYHLGMVYSKLRDAQNAEMHLKKAVVLGQGTPTANDAQEALRKIS